MCFPSKEFKKEHPVTAKTIKCFKKTSSAACYLLVFVVTPVTVIVLVCLGKISPWWLFLGCGPVALLACAGCYIICSEFCTA
ncbi:hypothetical protein DdX_12583 [Ditylenchus destructor]|uniref:Uncharacterized protein n=1 Tax=Ditylenchus destructor TaxID=166010 RepID=A0AAD4MUZ7_9BILA|nr:hypothetical protein DdX_12583 [Ditylenchus destructor]